ncbi:hypothetical protein ACRS6B_00490 [Nocardia asteroides]
MTDYAHSDAAAKSRAEKARRLANYLWQRGITGAEVLAMPAPVRRKLAKAAETNPPSTDETWTVVARLLTEKDDWAARHPEHPAARRGYTDEKLLWVKPRITPWL